MWAHAVLPRGPLAGGPDGPYCPPLVLEERAAWYVTLNGKRLRLASSKANKKLADAKFHELMVEVAANPAPDLGRPTVVTVIKAFLAHAERHLDARSFYERRAILQRFASARSPTAGRST